MNTVVENCLRFLSRWLLFVAGVSLSLMMLNVIADVLLKHIANSPIPGTAELVANYYMVAAVFLPLPLVEMDNKAIYVDLFYNRMRLFWQRVSMALAYSAQLVFFGMLAWQSAFDAIAAYAKGEYVEGIINVVVWPGRFCLPIGFSVAAAVSLLRLLQVMTQFDWKSKTSPAQDSVNREAL